METIPSDNGRDVFEVAGRDGRVVLRGNNAVSIASALNWYLEKDCHCDLSWGCGDQLRLPAKLPPVSGTARRVSPCQYRYAYNFCTYGYTMLWWRWPQ
ncbi:MAG: alpha-N-acetylglucosaminidase N-terminal domain-containing protein [Verrucomicrobiota bacterium]|nr:alpha-N-acetylglucosaminidase N-terminal domain-containing protein [Verrucomicrobiota bacterium]